MNIATMHMPIRDAAADSARLTQHVMLELSATGYPSLWNVAVSVHEGLVTLRGTVSCYYEKQIAQTAALRVGGVESLQNEIVVAP